MSPRRIALIRHGETAGQSSIRFHGMNDVPLSDEGRGQIRGLVPLLGPLGDLVPGQDWARARWVHSPLVRASESARILADGVGVDAGALAVEADFREIHFGRFEGMTAEEIQAADPEWHGAWRRGETDAWPGGDRVQDFADRVQRAWGRLLAATEGDLVVVAHRGVVRFGLRRLLALAPKDPDDFQVALGSVSIVVVPDAARSVAPGSTRADAGAPAPSAPDPLSPQSSPPRLPADGHPELVVYDRTAEEPIP